MRSNSNSRWDFKFLPLIIFFLGGSLYGNILLAYFEIKDKTVCKYYSIALLKLLASQLQIVRNGLQEYAKDKKKQVSIAINSGVRTQADYNRLKKSGYNPSETSDHFCGLQLKCKPTLGAADFTVSNCSLSLQEIVSMIIDWNKTGHVDFGQIILEYNPKTKSAWIHVGNDWN